MEAFSLAKEGTVWTYLRTVANKKRTFEDPLYKEGNAACKMQLQYVALDDVDDEGSLVGKCDQRSRFQCEVPGCGRWLGSLYEQEVHYNTSHRHSCCLCRVQLPSFHLLQLHLEECHDALFSLRAQRQPMYRCLLEWCDVLSADAASRQQHCVGQHCFPPDFSYCPPPQPTTTQPAAAVAGRPTQRRVPERGVSFGADAVPSLGRAAAGDSDAAIDMTSLAAALDHQTL